jgi:hypothetical protein
MLMAVETGQLHKFRGMPLDSIDDKGIHLFLFLPLFVVNLVALVHLSPVMGNSQMKFFCAESHIKSTKTWNYKPTISSHNNEMIS